jgi:alkylhydroperoxidase family enzyme
VSRIKKVDLDSVLPDRRAELDAIVLARGQWTNMKRTLANSVPALRALMEWYPLRDEVQQFLAERLVNLYCHAISAQTDCLICSTFFRRILIDSGENPDDLALDGREAAVVAYGRQLAKDPNCVDELLYATVSAYFTPEQMVTLTAFGAIMVATNVFNNALRIPLDDVLGPYTKPVSSVPETGAGRCSDE